MRIAKLALPVTLSLVAALASCSSGPAGEQREPLELTAKQGANVVIDPADLAAAAHGGAVLGFDQPAHGTVEYVQGGGLIYKPDATFTGTEEIKIRTSDAVQLFPTSIPPLTTVGGVQVQASAYGSALTPVPGARGEFYGLTDRGPTVDGREKKEKVEPVPGFVPQIGKFRLEDGAAKLIATIDLKGTDGRPLNGQANPAASTGERIVDLDGNEIPPNDHGLDPEGLVALGDGSFWIADEYGPFLVHFDRNGQELQRLAPGKGLPQELASRNPNQGLEGLTVTPDGKTLVAALQSALAVGDGDPKSNPVTRIVTVNLVTGEAKQYVYLLDDPKATGKGISAMTALSGTEFLTLERDGKPAPEANKTVYRVNLADATALPAGSTPETEIGPATVATEARNALKAAGITPVEKTLVVDLGKLIDTLNPDGYFFGHDKIEGLATTDGGKTLYLSNDSDFGIAALASPKPPFALTAKTQPNGLADTGEILRIDTTLLPPKVRDSRIRITVG